MARVYSEGFEMQDVVGLTVTYTAINTSIKRSGAASLFINGGQDNFTIPVGDLSEFYFRCGVYWTTDTWLAAGFHIKWRNGTTVLGEFYIDMIGAMKGILKVGSTTVSTGAITITESNWYLIEVHVKIDDATGELGLKVDGIADGTFSGDTKPDANTVVDNIYIYNNHSGAGTYLRSYIDDLALNDTAGGVDDSWCGDGKIILLKPDGDTATLQLTPSAAVDHYTLVDDIPADGDTTYVESSVDDEEDIYDLAACGLTDVIINRIWTEARAKDTTASGLKVALITKASGGAEVSGGDITLGSSYTIKALGAEETVNPVDSNPWEVADLDALQGGVRKRS